MEHGILAPVRKLEETELKVNTQTMVGDHNENAGQEARAIRFNCFDRSGREKVDRLGGRDRFDISRFKTEQFNALNQLALEF